MLTQKLFSDSKPLFIPSLFVSCLLLLTFAPHAHAGTSVTAGVTSSAAPNVAPSAQEQQATETATKQTQELLRNQQSREKSMTTPESKSADKQVKDLMGSDSQALYELAADILPTIINEGGGDPIKIQASMDQLMKNPESFSSKLTPAQLARLKELAKRVEDRKPSGTAPH